MADERKILRRFASPKEPHLAVVLAEYHGQLVTWTENTSGGTGYAHGHYFSKGDRDSAEVDFFHRAVREGATGAWIRLYHSADGQTFHSAGNFRLTSSADVQACAEILTRNGYRVEIEPYTAQ